MTDHEHSTEISSLNTLIATTIDSITGYEDAASNSEAAPSTATRSIPVRSEACHPPGRIKARPRMSGGRLIWAYQELVEAGPSSVGRAIDDRFPVRFGRAALAARVRGGLGG